LLSEPTFSGLGATQKKRMIQREMGERTNAEEMNRNNTSDHHRPRLLTVCHTISVQKMKLNETLDGYDIFFYSILFGSLIWPMKKLLLIHCCWLVFVIDSFKLFYIFFASCSKQNFCFFG
jgi:hypothetical protein